jgi:hypothetical protein
MQRQQESIETRRQRLGVVMRELAADLVEERRRRFRLEREVQDLRARLAAYESPDSQKNHEPQQLR